MTMNQQSGDIDERAEQLDAMTRRLVRLIANADWDEKERLVHAWRLEVARIKANPALLAGISAARKASLKDASRELEAMLEAHAVALSASKAVTEGLVRSIAAEVAAVRSAPAGYGRTGSFNSNAPRQASGVALNAKA
jgi:ATP-dependent protease ClpP protease subunit